jgi:hypothetical protein
MHAVWLGGVRGKGVAASVVSLSGALSQSADNAGARVIAHAFYKVVHLANG